MADYTVKLRIRGEKYSFEYNAKQFNNEVRAFEAAREAVRLKSDKYDKAIVVKTVDVKQFDIPPKPHGTRPKSHKKAPK